MVKDVTSESEVIKHSKFAFEKWKSLWTNNCKENRPRIKTNLGMFVGKYSDRTAVLFSFGPSLIPNIKKFKRDYEGRTDIVIGCVDKAFKTLVQNGIQPDYCLLADGSVSVDWVTGADHEAIKKCLLISLVYGSPKWSELWASVSGAQNIAWYLNKDNIDTHAYFAPLSGCWEVIEAASNVGNSLVVFSVKIFGCRTCTLYGYDYSWKPKQYYGNGNHKKSAFLGNIRKTDINGDIVYTSDNMLFSADWLGKYMFYVKHLYNVSIFNCTGSGILKERAF